MRPMHPWRHDTCLYNKFILVTKCQFTTQIDKHCCSKYQYRPCFIYVFDLIRSFVLNKKKISEAIQDSVLNLVTKILCKNLSIPIPSLIHLAF